MAAWIELGPTWAPHDGGCCYCRATDDGTPPRCCLCGAVSPGGAP